MLSATTLSLPFFGTRKLGLQEELHALGIKTLNKRDVKEHQKQVLMQGYETRLAPILSKIHSVLYTLTCLPLLAIVTENQRVNSTSRSTIKRCFWLTFSILSVIGVFSIVSQGIFSKWSLCAIPCISGAVQILLYVIIGTTNESLDSEIDDSWTNTYFQDFRQGMPSHIKKRASTIEENIPKIQVEVQHYQQDPFLLAVRYHWGIFREEHVVGAWDTGVPEFDTV